MRSMQLRAGHCDQRPSVLCSVSMCRFLPNYKIIVQMSVTCICLCKAQGHVHILPGHHTVGDSVPRCFPREGRLWQDCPKDQALKDWGKKAAPEAVH